MPNSTGAGVANYNEGVGHGAFIAPFQTAGNVILESFDPHTGSKVIEQDNQIGAPRKQALVQTWITATATAAIEVTEGTNPVTAPKVVQIGDTFGPDPFENLKWVVNDNGRTYQAGSYWKQSLMLRALYNQ